MNDFNYLILILKNKIYHEKGKITDFVIESCCNECICDRRVCYGFRSRSGSDWANAKNDLGEVLYNASAGTTVHVGAGVYKPTVDYKGNSTAPNIEKRFKL